MKTFESIAYVLFGLLGAGVTAFCLWIAPALVLEISDFILSRIPAGWTFVLENYFYSLVREINEHLHFIDQEISRHRKNDRDGIFTSWVREVRETNEGRRMPVNIRG